MDRLLELSKRLERWTVFEPNTGCLLWFGSQRHNGYGQLSFFGRVVKAHRMAYELAYGPIPSGISVLHKCDTPACCNPKHLFAGTALENARDMSNKNRDCNQFKNSTHCKNGHEFNKENTKILINSDRPYRTRRQCRKCLNVNQKNYDARTRKESRAE